MTIIAAIILGLIQGITEYFPISSSGHLSLIPPFLEEIWPALDFSFQTNNFDILLHIATFFGLLLALYPELKQIGKQIIRNKDYKVLSNIVIASIPLAILGGIIFVFFNDWQQPEWLGIFSLIAIGIWLIAYDIHTPQESNPTHTNSALKKTETELNELDWWKSLIIGIFEATAILRGVSRSGITFLGGSLMGLSRRTALNYSFILSIPIFMLLTGAEILFNLEELFGGSESQLLTPEVGVGMIAAFISSYIAIRIFKNFIHLRGILIFFGVYRILLALVLVVF